MHLEVDPTTIQRGERFDPYLTEVETDHIHMERSRCKTNAKTMVNIYYALLLCKVFYFVISQTPTHGVIIFLILHKRRLSIRQVSERDQEQSWQETKQGPNPRLSTAYSILVSSTECPLSDPHGASDLRKLVTGTQNSISCFPQTPSYISDHLSVYIFRALMY